MFLSALGDQATFMIIAQHCINLSISIRRETYNCFNPVSDERDRSSLHAVNGHTIKKKGEKKTLISILISRPIYFPPIDSLFPARFFPFLFSPYLYSQLGLTTRSLLQTPYLPSPPFLPTS